MFQNDQGDLSGKLLIMSNPLDRYLDLNGLRLHYLDWGESKKQPLLMLHGFMAHAHSWDEFAYVARTNYHVLALDQRGHGESRWSVAKAYTIEDHFLDLCAFVNALQLPPLILMGHSMGGRNALFYAACKPQEISDLILVDARPGNHPKAAEALHQQILSMPLVANSLDEIKGAIRLLYPNLSLEICLSLAWHGYKQEANGQYVPKYDRCMSLNSELSGNAVEDLWPFLKNITCRALIVRGKESQFLSLEDARKMVDFFPHAELAEIPKASHLPMQENPKVFAEEVLNFLKNKESKS